VTFKQPPSILERSDGDEAEGVMRDEAEAARDAGSGELLLERREDIDVDADAEGEGEGDGEEDALLKKDAKSIFESSLESSNS